MEIQEVLNSKGQPVNLTDREMKLALHNQNIIQNALGFEIPITTLTAISKRVVEQKFFTVAPADYMPVRVGENSWSADILTYRDFSIGGDFETGMINTGSNNSKLAEADAAIDSITVPVRNWAKQISWSLPDLQLAAKSGNWDLVSSKERARKKNWDLGIQATAFVGLQGDSNVRGLITQSDVTANTSLITKTIASMSASEFNTFVQAIVATYRTNCAYTAFPTHFIIPEHDYNGLVAPVSESYPMVNKLSYLLEAFKVITQNPNFKILPLSYAVKTVNAAMANLNKNRYTLLNYDEDSLRMDIPVDYTNTLQNTVNGFNFQNVGYGQFTGLKAYRPKEMLYFDF